MVHATVGGIAARSRGGRGVGRESSVRDVGEKKWVGRIFDRFAPLGPMGEACFVLRWRDGERKGGWDGDQDSLVVAGRVVSPVPVKDEGGGAAFVRPFARRGSAPK